MRLKGYLASDGNSASKLADAVGVSVSTITRAASGQTLPNHATRRQIVIATNGLVTSADIFAEHDEFLNGHAEGLSDELSAASTGQIGEMSRQPEGCAA